MRLKKHMLARAQEGWDNPGDAAAMADHRSGDLSHKAEAATAINESDIRGRQEATKVARGLAKGQVAAWARAAIDADIPKVSRLLHGTHVPLWALQRQGRLHPSQWRLLARSARVQHQ